ncbi:hypothetical protein PCYB_006250 [Plasmodium cynomolgi strain B]|uniref:Pv-fam-d protein n=1 Tax=Plasmodium cynomolgi (strain B) TaxID=1120755 RepID=K6UFC8_PLACD|nr:hypothetical protein PCYB_006250 [Plasmodium cynomolgi strain B]GAB69876.1 hypothetical protein PCYB_006250 [Plasmodium cynomolgi strain B]
MLTATERNRTREQNYVNVQKSIKTLLDEDDNAFGERLNKLAYDDNFRLQFNELLKPDLFKKPCNKLMQDVHFQKYSNKLNSNNNFEKHFFISPDADYSNHDQYNPFKFYNNKKVFFDELKSKNCSKAKIIDELKRHEECKTQPKDKMKRTNNLKREQTDEEEDYMPSKLEKDDISERSHEGYGYKELLKPRKYQHKTFEAEVKRFLKEKAAGRYTDKSRGIMGKLFSFADTHRVFIPIAFVFSFIFLVSTTKIGGIGGALLATSTSLGYLPLVAVVVITSLLGIIPLLTGLIPVVLLLIIAGMFPFLLPLMGVAALVYYAIKFDSVSSGRIGHKKLSNKIKYIKRKSV